jgi:predicted dehydrogenase
MINVAVCGFGYWGPNLVRNLREHGGFRVVAIAERDPTKRETVRRHYPDVTVCDDAAEAIDHNDAEAVVIVTPIASHYSLAKRALERGRHVLVEKPLCDNVDRAVDLVKMAADRELVLMVDHTFLFHPAVQKLRELVTARTLGRVSYYDCLRVNLGLFQPDVNVLWDLAPHDLSIIDYLFEENPIHVEASGYCHLNPRLPDIAYITLHFPSRLVAHLNLSWMSPVKVRRIAIGGTSKMAVWDDMDKEEPIRIYDSGISVHAQEERNVVMPSYRIGDVHAPRLPGSEALAGVVEHFFGVIRKETKSVMDGDMGLRIVRTMDWAQRALDASLASVDAHYTAQVPFGRAGTPDEPRLQE